MPSLAVVLGADQPLREMSKDVLRRAVGMVTQESFPFEILLLLIVAEIEEEGAAGEMVGIGDMGAQIRQVGENLQAALAAAGASLKDLVRTQTFTTDIDTFFKHMDVRMKYFGVALPTSTTVEVRRLSHPDFLVEVEAIAVI